MPPTRNNKRTPSNRQKAADENAAAAAANAQANKETRRRREQNRQQQPLQNTIQNTVNVDQAAELVRLREQLEASNARNAELTTQNTTLAAQATAAVANNGQQAANTANDVTDDSIPKPKDARKHIQYKMGLDGDPETFDRLKRTTREVVGAAKIRSLVDVTWRDLDASKKGHMMQALREREPFLRRFNQNWGAYVLLHQNFKNVRFVKHNEDKPEGCYQKRRAANKEKRRLARAASEEEDGSGSETGSNEQGSNTGPNEGSDEEETTTVRSRGSARRVESEED